MNKTFYFIILLLLVVCGCRQQAIFRTDACKKFQEQVMAKWHKNPKTNNYINKGLLFYTKQKSANGEYKPNECFAKLKMKDVVKLLGTPNHQSKDLLIYKIDSNLQTGFEVHYLNDSFLYIIGHLAPRSVPECRSKMSPQ